MRVFNRSHYNLKQSIYDFSHKSVLSVFKRSAQLYCLPTTILPSDYSPRSCNTFQQTWVSQFEIWKIPIYQITLQKQKIFVHNTGCNFFSCFCNPHTHSDLRKMCTE